MKVTEDITKYIDIVLDFVSPYYIYLIYLIYIVYIFVYLGFIQPHYMDTFSKSVQVFVCIFLILRFNPLRKHVCKSSDSDIIFGSATFLLINLGMVQWLQEITINNVQLIDKTINGK